MRKHQRRVIPSVLILGIVYLVSVISLYAQPKPVKRNVEDVSPHPSAAAQLGPYYALVIGNNDYRYPLNKLLTAAADADSVARMLRDSYGFRTNVLHNATRDQILTALVTYRRTLPENSSLLIYYAGHGHKDRDADEAYWLPVDSQKDNNENWISADDITRDVRAIRAMHILIISDSCYSGALTRSVDTVINLSDRKTYLGKMLKSKSRTLLSSGSDEPVSDAGPYGHSVFAGALLQSLHDMEDQEFTASALAERLKIRVAGRSDQTPQYNLIRNSGHDYGDFVFYRHAGPVPDPGPEPGPEPGPGPEPPITPVVDRDSDNDAILSLIRAYEDAYNRRDANALWSIWPSSPAKTKRAIETAFGSSSAIKMNVQAGTPIVQPDGSATVKGTFSEMFTPTNGTPRPQNGDITFRLKRVESGWVLAEIK